jgi:hypothetical protein
LYYGQRCEKRLNACANETCSMQGSCVALDDSDVASCRCFLYYYGERCQHRTQHLKFIRTFIRVASIVAIVIVVAFYTLFIVSDLTRYFFCPIEEERPERGPLKIEITRVVYKNK